MDVSVFPSVSLPSVTPTVTEYTLFPPESTGDSKSNVVPAAMLICPVDAPTENWEESAPDNEYVSESPLSGSDAVIGAPRAVSAAVFSATVQGGDYIIIERWGANSEEEPPPSQPCPTPTTVLVPQSLTARTWTSYSVLDSSPDRVVSRPLPPIVRFDPVVI